ncbi:MAG: GTP-binding protein [Betaproteobacteria bacterium]|nr:GTP-binding protein [Betaproteobacteria bacterium]
MRQRGADRAGAKRRMIPVSVITGFLGSGKTTLLGRLLHHPAMRRTAVIINEFGAVGLDHDLIETSDESFIRLSNGCLCCNIRSDLVATLGDLAVRRAAGTMPPFERVVIETTGLADPAPILHADPDDRAVVRADHGDDRRLARVNPGAPVLPVVSGAVEPSALFDSGLYNVAGKHPDVQAWLAQETVAAAGARGHHDHSAELTSFCVVRDEPVRAVTLALFLSALAENCGADLLRMKGIVRVAEQPDRPAVIHGVQHVYHAPVWLERWPSEDRRTRMVFIGRDIRESWVRGLLDLLDAEVAMETARHGVGTASGCLERQA